MPYIDSGKIVPSDRIELVPTPCFHTWTIPAARHIHRCGMPHGCHPAPCLCRCGVRDYCTLNGITTSEERGTHKWQKPGEKLEEKPGEPTNV